MSNKTELHLLLLDALRGLVEECRVRPSASAERRASFKRGMLAQIEILSHYQSGKARDEILLEVSKLNEIVLTNPDFDSEVANALLKLTEGPTSDPSETVKRKISTIPPPPQKSSAPPEEDL
ncbi:MAG: hypothetical protein P1P90_06515 [Patescibacteria group bacterium]|nr:hypothetical protein [Patescibacteria group bacterium]